MVEATVGKQQEKTAASETKFVDAILIRASYLPRDFLSGKKDIFYAQAEDLCLQKSCCTEL